MTNPDREELVKLAAELSAMPARLPYKHDRDTVELASAILRRLASSEDAVKGEPVALSASERACYLWPDDTEQARACRAAYIDGAKDYTAPPAEAGMREALENVRDQTIAKIEQLKHYRSNHCQLEHARTIADGRIAQAEQCKSWLDAALTAPGATTKSDGGECVCSGHQQPNCAHYRMGRCADKSGPTTKSDGGVESRYAAACAQPRGVEPEVAPGPSDPSSTRSEVAVGELAKAIYAAAPCPDLGGPLRWEHLNSTIKYKHATQARALLDQFEIRRKS